jgi:hypothetical protein
MQGNAARLAISSQDQRLSSHASRVMQGFDDVTARLKQDASQADQLIPQN